MKKYILLIIFISIMATGCFGASGKGELKSVCRKEIKSTDIEDISTYEIDYKRGNVEKVKILRSYKGIDMKNALESYKKAYINYDGVDIETTDNSITYIFDMDIVNEDIKSNFDLKKIYNEQIKILEEKGFTCN